MNSAPAPAPASIFIAMTAVTITAITWTAAFTVPRAVHSDVGSSPCWGSRARI